MRPNLLTLDDPILRLIAYHLNDDNFLPLPSFGPFWKNFARPASGRPSKNLRAFRGVSRRLRAVVQLDGLHVWIQSVERMRRWIWDAPEGVKRGVRRLILDVPTPDLGQAGHPYVLFELFTTVLHLLGGFPSLQEVEIYNLPTCDHAGEFPRGIRPSYDIYWPTGTRLGNIKALALTLRYRACRGIGASVALLDNLPHLTSLKIIGDSTDLWGMDYPFLRTLRLSSFPPYDPSALSRLTRLFVRCGLGQPTDFAMRKIHKLCPGIVEVHLVPFNGGSFDISYYFEKRFDFRMELDQDEGWKLYDKPDVLEVLHNFRALQVLDLVEQVVLDHEEQGEYDARHFGTTPSSSYTYHELFDRLIAASAERKALEQRYEAKLEEAQKAAARALVENCPTLRRGWWWRTVWLDGEQVYERRGWTANTQRRRAGD